MADVICLGELLIDLVPTQTGMDIRTVPGFTRNEDLDKSVAELWHDKLKLVAVTRGSRDCRYFTPNSGADVETFKVAAEDSAGDVFVPGLLQGIVSDTSVLRDPQKTTQLCRFANAVGTLTTTSYGTIPVLPDLQQVHQFLDEHK
jgi:fructokinase